VYNNKNDIEKLNKESFDNLDYLDREGSLGRDINDINKNSLHTKNKDKRYIFRKEDDFIKFLYDG
jgi:hypothetical protein